MEGYRACYQSSLNSGNLLGNMSEELQAQLEARINQLESRNSQLEAQNSQLQDSLTEYVESASSMSQATKKQRILTWADILCPLQIAMPKNIECIISPNNFHNLPIENKKLTLELLGLEDQFAAINDEVARSLGGTWRTFPFALPLFDWLLCWRQGMGRCALHTLLPLGLCCTMSRVSHG